MSLLGDFKRASRRAPCPVSHKPESLRLRSFHWSGNDWDIAPFAEYCVADNDSLCPPDRIKACKALGASKSAAEELTWNGNDWDIGPFARQFADDCLAGNDSPGLSGGHDACAWKALGATKAEAEKLIWRGNDWNLGLFARQFSFVRKPHGSNELVSSISDGLDDANDSQHEGGL